MIIKRVKPEKRDNFFTILFSISQLAIVISIFLSRMESEIPAVNFITGILMGFSIVGNIAFLIRYGQRHRSGQNKTN